MQSQLVTPHETKEATRVSPLQCNPLIFALILTLPAVLSRPCVLPHPDSLDLWRPLKTGYGDVQASCRKETRWEIPKNVIMCKRTRTTPWFCGACALVQRHCVIVAFGSSMFSLFAFDTPGASPAQPINSTRNARTLIHTRSAVQTALPSQEANDRHFLCHAIIPRRFVPLIFPVIRSVKQD
ncbi:hypothetical protein BKA56DRAFT_47231 [Ilyonectria sp. MPI-CAGE-AT-0026]|nr:hypothetical protein BKA56DRAFT_47231 [Ilyonectria sp. MPI-CAGE-AT-0026]